MKTEGHIIRGKLTENSANLKQENWNEKRGKKHTR